MDIYEAHTGDTESKPLVIGGGLMPERSRIRLLLERVSRTRSNSATRKMNELLWTTWFRLAKIYAEAMYRL